MSQIFRTIPVKAYFTDEEKAFWTEQCKASNSLYNTALYLIKQAHLLKQDNDHNFLSYWVGDDIRLGRKLGKVKASYPDLCAELKAEANYKTMSSQSAQQTIKTVVESINSFNSLVNLFFKSEVDRPRLPKYRKSGGLFCVTFPSQHLKYENGFVFLPISREVKPELLCEIKVELPHFIDFDSIRELRIRPSRGEFWVDWIINDEIEPIENNPSLQYSQFLAIDHGVKFWLSCVTTKGRSFIVEAPKLKTELFKYRDKVAKYKEGKSDFFWDNHLRDLTMQQPIY